ncbi:hypothetical protein AXG93_1793s1360 [Marchantia polymorpha subsp. ruderalis]|uniref:Phospholipid scramblase n=1 Tax=Marchantia polymorpha subsp. ruderalis TaxID=1480154 RepID=A0A176WIM8_MARPO|nr:hypothetical protein AXG93_1793s1360 [Marchantia polymorpha subsp. ruderalis]
MRQTHGKVRRPLESEMDMYQPHNLPRAMKSWFSSRGDLSLMVENLIKRARADKRRREERARKLQSRVRTQDDDDVSYPDSGEFYMDSNSTQERLAAVLGRPDLIITRNVEWANLAFGFEQQNKYVIMDPREPQAPVGYILEDSNIFMRQFLRRRRPFVALVLDAYGNEVCRVRRPAWLINSTIYVEVDGQASYWKQQFASVENPGFWYWTFTLQDANQGLLAVIDRNWRGFGYEFLTDAGQYVVRFGDTIPDYIPAAYRPATVMETVRANDKPVLAGSPSAISEIQNLQTAAQEAEPLVVDRPLTLTERAVTLALAVSLDNDYFSNHSQGVGFFPLPFFGGGSEVADADRNLPMEDDSSGYSSAAYNSTADDLSSEPAEPAEPLERVIASDDSGGEPFHDSWNDEDVEEAIFGDSRTDSWTDDNQSQGHGLHVLYLPSLVVVTNSAKLAANVLLQKVVTKVLIYPMLLSNRWCRYV